ncbi:hypothetical protein MLD38_026107 [Melastoma candidum]|uniref:Uncharacterized protein n=1 Tax=Melastoma candidum TaxID=119954 RepID=A0ACB9NYJ0_9MYRT|nr:hypothetical protein MLD38_026107 [Melastoma candidum]
MKPQRPQEVTFSDFLFLREGETLVVPRAAGERGRRDALQLLMLETLKRGSTLPAFLTLVGDGVEAPMAMKLLRSLGNMCVLALQSTEDIAGAADFSLLEDIVGTAKLVDATDSIGLSLGMETYEVTTFKFRVTLDFKMG